MEILLKKLHPQAHIPTRGSEHAAGYDLYACLPEGELIIPPNESRLIGTGISCALPEGTFAACFARSGLAFRQGLRPANCVGVVDSDYRGEYCIVLHNDGKEPRTVEHGERIAQLVLLPYLPMEFCEVDSLSQTRRGAGGFGSTGN